MAKTIAFHLQKGGVGKTTISGTLACQSAIGGHNTLIIDCDPQGNLSSWFLMQPPKFELSDVLQGRCFIGDAIVKAPGLENLSILPTFGIGGTLKNYSETKLAEEPFVIQDLVKDVSEDYDHIILDLSPGLGRLERSGRPFEGRAFRGCCAFCARRRSRALGRRRAGESLQFVGGKKTAASGSNWFRSRCAALGLFFRQQGIFRGSQNPLHANVHGLPNPALFPRKRHEVNVPA